MSGTNHGVQAAQAGLPAPPPAPPVVPSLLRSTAAVTAGNLVSRVTGFLRVLAIGLVLGTTFAGNTYQTSNLVSNVLFEFVAAGLLSSVLVPPFVRLLENGRREDAEDLAGSVLGVALAGLALLTGLALLVRPWIMRLLTLAVDDPAVREQEIALGSFLLVLFLPQVLLYAVGSVATGLLHGTQRFAAAAFAPVANNLTVIATMVLFWVVQGGDRPGLDLSTADRLVLGGGTTLGVVAMTLVPVVALRRAGIRLRPRWNLRQEGLGRLARSGVWAAGLLACAQLLIVTTLVLANQVEGGVVAYHIAFQLFLLPFALFAHPVITALYPRLAANRGEPSAFTRQLGGGLSTLAFLVLPASALLVALAGPALRLLRWGNIDAEGSRLIARLVVAFGVGLIGYAAFQLLTRASYVRDDARTPTLVGLGVAVAGSVVMAVWFGVASGDGRLTAVGYGHSIAYVGGALVLAAFLVGRAAGPLLRSVARSGLCAGVAGAVAFLGGHAFGESQAGAAAGVAVGGLAAVAVYLGGQRALGAPEPAWLRQGTG